MSRAGVLTTPTARCPRCSQVWLVPRLKPGERCACKGCGRLITVSARESMFDVPAADIVPAAGSRAILKDKERNEGEV